jgi:hypothetical protein
VKNIWLHVGPHKTGTTYLQKVFFENSDTFQSNGWDYLDYGMVAFGQHGIVTDLKKKTLAHDRLSARIASSEARNILISSENFDLLTRQEIDVLSKAFSGCQVYILAAFRTPSSRMYSWWQEEVKHGSYKTYFEYVYPHYSKPYASDILNIQLVLDRYSSVFGEESIRVFDYNWCSANGGVLEHFLKVVGCDLELEVTAESINKSLSPVDIELIRVLNALAKRKGVLDGYNVRDGYLKKWNRNSDDMEVISKLIGEHSVDVVLGDLYADKVLRGYLLKHLAPVALYGELSLPETSTKTIPNESWVYDSQSNAILERIFEVIL